MTGRRSLKIGRIVVALTLALAPTFGHAVLPPVEAQLSHLADTSHLELKGRKNWQYEVQRRAPDQIEVQLPPLDAASVAKIQKFSDNLVRAVTVNKFGPDGTYVLTFHLRQPDVESFDYLTDEPSRLIVDFYQKAQPKKAATAKAKHKKIRAKSKRHAKVADADDTYHDVTADSRKPAGDEFLSVEPDAGEPGNVKLHFGIFDGDDANYDRFRIKDYEIRDDAILAARHNIYLPFPMLKMPVSRLDQMVANPPEFVIDPKNTLENKRARLVLTLYQRHRDAVFLKTYNFFVNKYPHSEYNEILKNLAAHVYLKRWRDSGKPVDFDQARALIWELVEKYPSSPLREYNYLLLGFAEMERGDALATLQTFEGFMNAYPKSKDIPQVRKALAESDIVLLKYPDATKQYEQIIKDFPKTKDAEEARYRLGDVAFSQKDYQKALSEYQAAVKQWPQDEKIYPNADYNMAESRFWLKDYKNSLNDYVQFVQNFPTNAHGGYALTRIGELLGILGADKRRMMGAFLESYFRFPDDPGAKVARIRMLSQRMRGMKPQELKKALQEIGDLAKSLKLDGINEFTTLMTAQGLASRGQYKEALDQLIRFYQQNPGSNNLDIVKSRIQRNISDELKSEVENGKFIEALRFYSKYADTWLKNSGRIDIPYYIAGAYEKAGDYKSARAIYEQALAAREKIVGTEEEKEKKIQEHLPSPASLHLRIASTMAADRDYIGAYQQLRALKDSDGLTPAEVIERVQLGAKIAEQRNEPELARKALMALAEKWKGDPALLAPVDLQLAQTFLKLGKPAQSLAYADKALASDGGETKVNPDVIAGALQVKGDALFSQNRAMAAVEAYQKLLDGFETKMPLGSVRYKVGEILFKRGDRKGAEEVWKHLQGTSDDFLWKIGKEKLDSTQWRDQYKQYIDRIPAMANGPRKETAQ